MDKPLNTEYIYEFEDGTTATMTLAFYKLLALRSKNKSAYERYNKAMNRMGDKKSEYDELDAIEVLYSAYLCANIGDIDNAMTYEEFIMKCGSDRVSLGKAMQALTSAKKQQASANRS